MKNYIIFFLICAIVIGIGVLAIYDGIRYENLYSNKAITERQLQIIELLETQKDSKGL